MFTVLIFHLRNSFFHCFSIKNCVNLLPNRKRARVDRCICCRQKFMLFSLLGRIARLAHFPVLRGSTHVFADSGRSSRRVIGNLLVAGDSFTFFLELGLQLCSLALRWRRMNRGSRGWTKGIKMREGTGATK